MRQKKRVNNHRKWLRHTRLGDKMSDSCNDINRMKKWNMFSGKLC